MSTPGDETSEQEHACKGHGFCPAPGSCLVNIFDDDHASQGVHPMPLRLNGRGWAEGYLVMVLGTEGPWA